VTIRVMKKIVWLVLLLSLNATATTLSRDELKACKAEGAELESRNGELKARRRELQVQIEEIESDSRNLRGKTRQFVDRLDQRIERAERADSQLESDIAAFNSRLSEFGSNCVTDKSYRQDDVQAVCGSSSEKFCAMMQRGP
jgi:septal ring factor EnvC (AmiA/AmiB activator)